MSQRLPACPVGVDDSLGPWAGDSCRGGFDFTLLFEEAILVIPLQCLFLVAMPIRVAQLVKTDTKVVSSPQRWFKACACACLLGFNATLLALWMITSPVNITLTRATVPAVVLVFVASIGCCLLSWLEHERSLRPSFVLSTYLFFSILLDTARARTLWMMGPTQTIPAVFTCSLALRAVMFIFESTEKRHILLSRYKGYSKEETSGTASRSVFFWLTSLFLQGYGNILKLDDLYPLDRKLHTQPLHRALAKAWETVPNKTAPGALLKTWLRVFARPVMSAVIPKLFQIGFTYAQPFLVNAAINLARQPQKQPYDNIGYGLIGAYAIVYTGIAISTGQYEWRNYRAATMMRGSLVAMVYQKSLRLNLSSPNVQPDAALTLVNTDTETVMNGIVMLHDLWGGLLEIAIAIYLISRELGAACVMPICFAIIVLISTGILAVPTGKAQAAWIQASQERVTVTSKTLSSIKCLKVSGLNDTAFSMLRKLRSHELKVSERFRMLMGVSMMILICAPIWIPILTFCVYAGNSAGDHSRLTISKAFTAYALLVLVTQPVSIVIVTLPVLAGAVMSCQRIQNHLNGKERVDNRVAERSEKDGGKRSHQAGRGGLEPAGAVELTEVQRIGTRALGNDIVASVNGTFAWIEDTEPVIDIHDWVIRRQTFTLLLGPVGCGKSTLLKCLLGELSSFNGTVRTNYSGVAYCGQTPWIPNQSVRNVIVSCENFDETWYRAVITACALEEDVRNWPDGDGTVTGTGGISLSGGQKHRLAIARALYSRREFLILDDVFSGLDAGTEGLVFNNLFGSGGLLRTANMTVLVASSDVRRAPYADQIVLLNDKGQIQDSGAYGELDQIPAFPGTEGRPTLRAEHKTTALRATDGGDKPTRNVTATLMIEADSTRRLGDPETYKFYATAAGWTSLTIFLAAMVIFAFCDVFPSVWLKWWAEANETDPVGRLGKWLGVYVALGVGSFVSVFIGARELFIVIINKTGRYFHSKLVDTTSRAPMSFHSSVDSGVTVNRFSQDLELIDMELPAAALGVAIALSFGTAQFLLICVSSKYLAVMLPFLLLVFYAVQHFYLRTSRQLRLLSIECKAPVYTQLIETLDGLETIRAYQLEDDFEQKNMIVLDDSQRPNYLLFCLQRWLTFAVDMMVAFTALILTIVITTLREQIGPGSVGIATTNILGFSNTVKAAITSWVMLETALGAVARVRSFAMETKPEDASDAPAPSQGRKDWPSQGAVELRGVTASYPSFGKVLMDVTLSILPGQKVAICGRTGSGKTSLMLCLLRMVQQDGGSILVDGVDISTLPHEHVRSRLVAMPQETYIFSGTVRLNVDPSETIPDEEIRQVLEKVRLWSKIEQRGGLDAVIHDKFFSQGEAQLLVFARAMLRKSRILLLDEITSSLDDETSRIIDDVLRSWFQGWTIIAIAHKLDSILGFDRVAVLQGGRLVEYDEPAKLLERDSAFKELYEHSMEGND